MVKFASKDLLVFKGGAVFICYARRDNDNVDPKLRWLDRVLEFLQPLVRQHSLPTDDSGMEQVGTVYTAQGFEFDYIGVIFGRDLVFDSQIKQWKSIPENSHDTQVKRKNANLTRYLKNVKGQCKTGHAGSLQNRP